MSPPETVFVIDDDELARKSIGALVESMGLNVEQYSSAEEFLEALDINRVGCLVTDVRLGGMDGLELQRQLKRRNSELPTVILTGYADASQAELARRAGVIRLLEKPCDHHELRDAILMALRAVGGRD